MKSATPDVTEDIASAYCKNCGSSLEGSDRILDYITQVVSLPNLNPIIKEFRHYITICKKCGKPIQSHAPRKRGTNAVIYDATVKIMVVYMSVVLFLPYGRIADFFEEVYLLEDPLIPSDNNTSERGIRKLKVKLKDSRTYRSDLGADAFFDIHSIVETTKNNIKLLTMSSVRYFKHR